MIRLAIAVAVVFAAIPAQAGKKSDPPASKCAQAENRQLDFWIGDWIVDWRRSDGSAGRGTNSVTREVDGCVIAEHFHDVPTGFRGMGIYSYFAPVRRWTETWMDNAGTTITASGGKPADGSADFVLTLSRGQNPTSQYRFVFSEVTQNRFVWRFQSRAEDAVAWADEAVSIYTRAKRR
jgi:hypothetical protein